MKKVEKKKTHVRTPLTGVFSKLNQNNLDKEAIRQLELMEEYGELSAEAVYQVARLEEKKKTVRSKIIIANQGKGNALVLEAMYRVDPEYVSVCSKLNEAIYESEKLKNAMFTLSHRKDAIEVINRRQIATSNLDVPTTSKRKG